MLFQREQQPVHRTRHADSKTVVTRAFLDRFALFVQIHVTECRLRRLFTIIDSNRFLLLRIVNKHEAATADITGTRQSDGQRKTDADGSIHSITALLQNITANGGSQRLLRSDHAIFRPDGMLDGVFRKNRLACLRRGRRAL